MKTIPQVLRTHAEQLIAVDATTKQLHQAAIRDGMTVSGDMRVNEQDAAKLLGYSPRYLKSLRQEGKAPTSYARGVSGGRVSYRLNDLSTWIETKREDW